MPVMQHVPLHYTPNAFIAVSVLAVTASEGDWNHLQQLFSHSRWRLERRRSLDEARDLLLTSALPAILCDATLPDGDWKQLMEFLSHFQNPPRVIVMSVHPDPGLWESVLDLGADDLLEKPLQPADLYHAISDAWRSWKAEAARDAHRKAGCSAERNRGEWYASQKNA